MGGICLSAELQPPARIAKPSSGLPLLDPYKAHQPWCTQGRESGVTFIGTDRTPGSGPHFVLGAAVLAATNVRVTFDDGSIRQLANLAGGWIVVWRGAKHLKQVRVDLPNGGFASCEVSDPSAGVFGTGQSCSAAATSRAVPAGSASVAPTSR